MTSEYRQQEFQHTPVLLAECLEQSNLKPQQTFVDATLAWQFPSWAATAGMVWKATQLPTS